MDPLEEEKEQLAKFRILLTELEKWCDILELDKNTITFEELLSEIGETLWKYKDLEY